MKYYLILFAFCTSIIFISCKEEAVQPLPLVDENNNGFASFEVAEILAKNCATSGCHEGTEPEHHLSFHSYSEMMEGSLGRPMDTTAIHDHPKVAHGGVYGGSPIIPFDAENSLMYRLITGNVQNAEFTMPYMETPLSQTEINVIKDWINSGAKDNAGNIPYSSSEKIYMCSQGGDKLFEIDSEHKVVSSIIDLDFNSTLIESPHNVQMRGNYVYVTLIASGRFLKIDKNTKTVVGSVEGIEKAGMIVLSPDGKTAYVSRSSSAASIYNTVYAVNTETMTIIGEINIPVTGLPHAMWLTSDGNILYIANMSKDRISIVNAHTLELADDDIVLSTGGTLVHEPMHIYLSPDDKYLYVNCRTSSKMLVINTETKAVVKELDIKNHPMQSSVSSDGNKIYVVSHHEPYITEVTKSGDDWAITREFQNESFHHLYGADLSPDDRYLYISCSNQTDDFKRRYAELNPLERPSLVCVYDTKTGDLVKIIDAGNYATGIVAREN